ncbi:unnamed protein product [Enterobius vermicularis]|uniref:TPR_REGION domain-containing protein n=1 Tax=Enterobius vermicularis TaxID=51028 RepID=A0A0N4VGT1_ENTVE|nr:unnamed protein product [Enterobius vermicularis]
MLALAAVHFRRSHFREAVDVYKKVLSDHKDYLAVQVYLALCYYKLEYYDVALDTLQLYLSEHPDSQFAINLQACAKYKLYNSKIADRQLHSIDDNSTTDCLNVRNLVAHNKVFSLFFPVVFQDGEGALLTLPSLVNTIPEARLNLIKFYLARDDLQSAFKLFEGHQPETPQEYLLQGTTYYKMSIEKKNHDYRRTATKLYLTVGESPTECGFHLFTDTVAGRQAMASAHFLSNQLDEALIYLDSIKAYFEDDDVFNYNFGQTLLANDKPVEAEEVLLRISDQNLMKSSSYLLNLIRAYCINQKGDLAWSKCSKWKHREDLPGALEILANDCYNVRVFEDYI